MALNFPSLDAAIASFEKSNPAYNNPGALAAGPFSTAHGAVGIAPNGLAIYPTQELGASAEDALVSQYAAGGSTLSELINHWAPGTAPGNTPESTAAYLDYVSKQTGIAPGDTLGAGAGPTAGDDTRNTIRGWFGLPPLDKSNNKPQTGIGLIDNIDLTFSVARGVAVLLGLMLIGGGLYLFKPVQEIVNTTARAAVA